MPPDGWRQRVDDLWASFDDHTEDEFLALAPHLPRYQRSLRNYARELGG
jgi:Tetratrico peptide repeat